MGNENILNGGYLGLPPADSRVKNPASKLGREYIREIMTRNPPGPPTAYRANQTINYSGVIYLCIEALADAMASCSVRVTQRRAKRNVAHNTFVKKSVTASRSDDCDWVPAPVDHPLQELFDDPNKVDTFNDFIKQFTIQEELYGTGIVWVNEDKIGHPREMWVLPTALTQQIPISPEFPCGGLFVYSYYPGFLGTYGSYGGSTSFDNRDLLIYRRQHPLYRWEGLSPATAGAYQLDILQAIDQARKNHMDRGWAPEVLVTLDGATSDECTRVSAELNARYSGSRGQKNFVTDGNGVDVKMLTNAAKDMDYSQGWEQMVKYACALWKTNSSIIGLTDADSYASFYAKLKQFQTQGLGPRIKSISAFLTKHLARPYYGRDFAIEFDPPTINDEENQRAWAGLNPGPLYTYNESRALINLPPVEGGDLPTSVYLKKLEQEAAPDEQPEAAPGMEGMPPGGPPQSPPGVTEPEEEGAGEGQEGFFEESMFEEPAEQVEESSGDDGADVQDAVIDSVLASLGVENWSGSPGPQRKSTASGEKPGPKPTGSAEPGTKPPFEGAVYDETIHRWIQPNKDKDKSAGKQPSGGSQPETVGGLGFKQLFANMANDMNDSYYRSLSDSIREKGELSGPAKQTFEGQAWRYLKDNGLSEKFNDAPERFEAAVRMAHAGGETKQAYADAMNHFFSGKKPPLPTEILGKPGAEEKTDQRPNAALDELFGEDSPEPAPAKKPPKDIRYNPEIDDVFGFDTPEEEQEEEDAEQDQFLPSSSNTPAKTPANAQSPSRPTNTPAATGPTQTAQKPPANAQSQPKAASPAPAQPPANPTDHKQTVSGFHALHKNLSSQSPGKHGNFQNVRDVRDKVHDLFKHADPSLNRRDLVEDFIGPVKDKSIYKKIASGNDAKIAQNIADYLADDEDRQHQVGQHTPKPGKPAKPPKINVLAGLPAINTITAPPVPHVPAAVGSTQNYTPQKNSAVGNVFAAIRNGDTSGAAKLASEAYSRAVGKDPNAAETIGEFAEQFAKMGIAGGKLLAAMVGPSVLAHVTKLEKHFAGRPEAKKKLTEVDQWAEQYTAPHVKTVAQQLGISDKKAKQLLIDMTTDMAKRALKTGMRQQGTIGGTTFELANAGAEEKDKNRRQKIADRAARDAERARRVGLKNAGQNAPTQATNPNTPASNAQAGVAQGQNQAQSNQSGGFAQPPSKRPKNAAGSGSLPPKIKSYIKSVINEIDEEESEHVYTKSSHRTPPRPGLVWKEETHRWVNPETGADHLPESKLKSAGKFAIDNKLVRAAKWAEHKLAVVSHKTRDIATEAAKVRGFDEEQTNRLARTLAIADFVGGYITGGVTTATVGPLAGKVVALTLPSVSAAYLAYSTAKNPRATWVAALKVVRDTVKGKKHE